MHHIRRFLKAASGKEIHDLGSAALPTELHILIASYVQRRGDLARLCRSSKRFRNIYTSFLYQKVEVQTGRNNVFDVAAQLFLYAELRSIRYSQVVTELRIRITASAICAKYAPSSSVRPASFRRFIMCSCDKYDRALGVALLSLHNLEVLVFQCTLCPDTHWHDYLPKLDIPKLKQFRFACNGTCTTSRIAIDPMSILLAPYIHNLTGLSIGCPYVGPSESFRKPEQLTRDKEVMRKLKILGYGVDDFSGRLLVSRPIERLCIEGMGSRFLQLDENIRQSPGQLTHLLMIDILQWLPCFMSRSLALGNPRPYRHLRFIGTITLRYLEEETALHDMRVFMPLDSLEVMEINRNAYYETSETEILFSSLTAGFSPTPFFFKLLGERHPNLRHVLLQRRTNHGGRCKAPTESDIAFGSVLWERSLDWEQRRVPYQDHWDMLTRQMDGI